MSNAVLFQLSDLHFRVGDKDILHNIEFSVYGGEFLTILGPSGAGKSSLLRMFNLMNSPTAGKILFRGQNPDRDILTLRKNVGMLFQNPVVLSGSVKDNLLLAGRWDHGIAQTLDHELRELLSQVGLENVKLSMPAKDMSGGEQQRLALARTLLNKPQVLLLDEPTSNLDQQLAGSIMTMIHNLQQQMGLTIIAVSHDFQLMEQFSSRFVVLSAGRVAAEGSYAELKDQLPKNLLRADGMSKA